MEEKFRENKTFVVKKRCIADTLAFLGFKYYKYGGKVGEGEEIHYTFLNTEEFQIGYAELMKLKKEIRLRLELQDKK